VNKTDLEINDTIKKIKKKSKEKQKKDTTRKNKTWKRICPNCNREVFHKSENRSKSNKITIIPEHINSFIKQDGVINEYK
jgi:hypothetical protein